METDFETIDWQLRDYVSPECACKVEDIVKAVPHVIEASFDPVNNLLRVKVHRGMASADDVIKELKECSVRCEQRMPAHEMAQMEHAARKETKPATREMAGMEHEGMETKKQ